MFTSRGQPVLRCAIYTRQSVARGEQDLTSCDVQRQRCEDYVPAMQYEGWVALDERFDNLGVSGGSLERPALRRHDGRRRGPEAAISTGEGVGNFYCRLTHAGGRGRPKGG
jgi:hypothetical protein